jgi:hypothetical protein
MRHREREAAAPAPVSDERILQLRARLSGDILAVDILGHSPESGR